jgi:hypothetical protein
MKREYDFSQGERGAVEPTGAGKTRITIRIDNDILDWFRARVHEQGGGNYQTLMNQALREHIERGSLEEALRRILREELGATSGQPRPPGMETPGGSRS